MGFSLGYEIGNSHYSVNPENKADDGAVRVLFIKFRHSHYVRLYPCIVVTDHHEKISYSFDHKFLWQKNAIPCKRYV